MRHAPAALVDTGQSLRRGNGRLWLCEAMQEEFALQAVLRQAHACCCGRWA